MEEAAGTGGSTHSSEKQSGVPFRLNHVGKGGADHQRGAYRDREGHCESCEVDPKDQEYISHVEDNSCDSHSENYHQHTRSPAATEPHILLQGTSRLSPIVQ